MMGSGEQFETEVLLARLPSTGVAVDLGANVGYYTILAARKVGAAGRVYAFEPDPENYRGLRTVVRAFGYGHVVLEDCAVSDRAGHARLYLSETNSGDHRIFDPGDGRRSVDVSTTSLDGYFAARGSIPRIDVVKMDIQGAEVAALRGMRQVIAANPLLILLTEFWPRGLLAAGSSAQEHLALLGELGLDFRRINEESRSLECVSVERLLETHTVEAGNYTNLICGRPEVLEP
jgi:FkbM family methyltransferase